MIYTVGHSTRSGEEFVALLEAHGVRQVADVRTVPHSRRHPQFGRNALERLLASKTIAYRHFPTLGGLRRARPDSINTAWRNASFRGYADHMQTVEFSRGLEELLTFAQAGRTAVMCAEALWWQCHRRLLSDAVIVRDVPVRHIISLAEAKPHELSEFACATGEKVIYPGLL